MKPGAALHSRDSLARRLRLQQIAVFQKVVEAGSILAASRELAMTQPAVSKSMRELEQQLGGVLFARGKRGVALTEFGSLFERYARTMLAEVRHLAEDLNDWQSGTAGHVVVGTLITASASLLPEAISRLRQAAPDVVVTVRVGSNSILFPALARGELDVVVGFLPADTPAVLQHEDVQARLLHVPLHDEGMRVVVARDHALARRRKISLAELHGLEWIVPTPDSVAYPTVRSFFAREGLEMPARRVESVSILTNLELLTRRPMVALMPQSAARRFAQSGLVALLPLQSEEPFGTVGYTLRGGRAPSTTTQRLLAALKEASEKLR